VWRLAHVYQKYIDLLITPYRAGTDIYPQFPFAVSMMPQFTAIPARSGLPATELYTRISTPTSHDSEHIDPAIETVVFIHPLWTDSFFL